MRSSNLKFAFVMTGHSAYSEKMSDPEMVMEVIERLSKRLGMKGNFRPYCVKMTHPDPKRTFIVGGIVAQSRTVLLDTLPGRKELELRVFSSRGLKGFQKIAEKVVRESFDLSGYEMDIHKLEDLK